MIVVSAVVCGMLLTLSSAWVWAVADVMQRPASDFDRIDQSRGQWVSLVILLPVLGAALYLALIRPLLLGRP